MGVTNNFLAIEDDIVEKMSVIDVLKNIYRAPISEFLSDENIELPCLGIAYKGYVVKQSSRRRQSLATFWEIGVLCKRENYIDTGGFLVLQVMQYLRSKTSKYWLGEARLSDVDKRETEPEFSGRCALFPVVFEIDVVIVNAE